MTRTVKRPLLTVYVLLIPMILLPLYQYPTVDSEGRLHRRRQERLRTGGRAADQPPAREHRDLLRGVHGEGALPDGLRVHGERRSQQLPPVRPNCVNIAATIESASR